MVLADLVHHDVWVCRYGHNANLTFCDIAQLDLTSSASLDFDAWAMNAGDRAAEHLSFTVHTLQVNADEAARTYMAVLNHAAVLPLGDDVHGTLLEVGELAIGDLDVRINRNGSRRLISFIADKLAANQVQRGLREAHQSSELLLETLRDRFERQNALAEDDAAGIQADDAVHVAADFEFLQRLHARLLPVFDILHSLEDVLEELDTGVRERYPFEVDQLTLLELHIDDGALVAHNYNLSVFVLLLDRQAGLRDRPLTCVDTLRQADNCVRLRDLQSFLERLDRPLLRIYLVDVRILKVPEHLVVDVLSRAIQITQLPCLMQVFHIFVEPLRHVSRSNVTYLRIDLRQVLQDASCAFVQSKGTRIGVLY